MTKEVGIAEEAIAQICAYAVQEPIRKLDRCQDAALIANAEIVPHSRGEAGVFCGLIGSVDGASKGVAPERGAASADG